MLTAQTKNGNKLCLGNGYKKETLLSLRNKEEFFCPVCKEKVILKLGDSKIYHFAHLRGGSCRDFYENESEYHMEGKLKLFQWLKLQGITSELEYYDPEIQQRPDILFYYHNQKYALEYQCSTISEPLFKKRTENYLSHGYKPFWVIGGNNFNERFQPSSGLTNFHYLFLRQTKDGRFFIPSFSPTKGKIQILHSIFPYASKNTLFQSSFHSIEELKLPSFVHPDCKHFLNINQWRNVSEKYKLHWSMYPSTKQRHFLNELYTNRLNLFLFPPEIGLPVPRGFFIRTPPFIWQAYFYLDVINNKPPGTIISMGQMKTSIEKRIKANHIQIRTLPQIESQTPLSAFMDYANLLVKIGVFTRKGGELFQIQRAIKIPETNREKEKMVESFFKHLEGKIL